MYFATLRIAVELITRPQSDEIERASALIGGNVNPKLLQRKLDPSKLEQPTDYAKYVVWLGWDVNGTDAVRGMGIILSKNIILTNYAINLINERTYIGDKKISASGFVTYGLTEFVQRPPKEQLIDWKKAVTYKSNALPGPLQPQIALIKLNKNMKLNSKQAAAIPLPPDEHKKFGKKCVVVGWGRTNRRQIVQTRAVIVRKNKCYNHLSSPNAEDSDKIICIDVPDAAIKTHCEHFTNGAPLICEGMLTGVVSWQWICDGGMSRPCASVYKLRYWIKSHMKELGQLSKLETNSRFSKHVVWQGLDALGLKTLLGMGVILDRNTILTSYTLNLTNAAAYYQGVPMPVYGFVVYGIPRYLKEIPISNDVDWNKMINFGYKLHPKPFQPQIALITLNDPMDLDSQTAAAISLPTEDLKEEPVSCVVVGFGLENDEDIVESEVVIVKRDECKRKIPDLYDEAICIDIPAYAEVTHCDQFTSGAPLICDGLLIGIVSYQDPCMPNHPRLCISVYKLRNWIRSNIKIQGRLSNDFSSNSQIQIKQKLVIFNVAVLCQITQIQFGNYLSTYIN
uniref:Peptidase S1 domain-containing protein n=1 Tax=Glossina brevipalpis TaxID=37001 RepID=A0A1A9WD00_9MUSC